MTRYPIRRAKPEGATHRQRFYAENKIWVKWAPNLVAFAAAFCSLRTNARQGSNSESLPPRPGPNLGHLWLQGACFGLSRLPIPSLRLLISVSTNNLMDQIHTETKWSLPYRLPRFSSAAHLSRSQWSRHGNPALQSQGGQDNTESQTVQGASQPTRPTLFS